MYATEAGKLPPHRTSRLQWECAHSWTPDIICSTVPPLCFLCLTLSGRRGRSDFRVREADSKDVPLEGLCRPVCFPPRMHFCSLHEEEWALLVEGSISSPGRPGGVRLLLPLSGFTPVSASADCDRSTTKRQNYRLSMWGPTENRNPRSFNLTS